MSYSKVVDEPFSPVSAQHEMQFEDDKVSDIDERGRLREQYELEDLNPGFQDTKRPKSRPHSEFDDWESEDENNPQTYRSRRPSVSTVQSFILYTPDEERSVIKKFDKRLVLFVALLYMLSFLDRSSMSFYFCKIFPMTKLGRADFSTKI